MITYIFQSLKSFSSVKVKYCTAWGGKNQV